MSETFPQPPVVADLPLGHIDALPAGTMLGEFEVQDLLGVGGFGMVYRGYDHSLHRPVAIKEYMPSSLVGRAASLQVSVRSTADDQPFQAGLTSFIAEARLLAQFDHPSLVKVYRFWEANNTAYMAMPLYQGITLKQARRQMSAPPPEQWLRTVLWSVLQALKVLHDNGTIHRDVSPDNIFLQDEGPPVLLDLGAARRAVLDRDHKHTAVLKVNYAPIEQYADATGLQEGAWTDLYALGAVVHGCLRNESPLPATIRVVRDRMPSFFRVAQTVSTHFGIAYSTPFVDAISHTLVIEPAHRTQSVLDLCEEMQLEEPDDLARFDWRRELGDLVTLGNETPDLLLAMDDAPSSEKTLTQPHAFDADLAKRALRTKRKRRLRSSRDGGATDKAGATDTGPHPILWWIVAFLFAASVALGVAAWVHPAKVGPHQGGEDGVLVQPEPVETPAPAASVDAASPQEPVPPVVIVPPPEPVLVPEPRLEPVAKPAKPRSSTVTNKVKKEKPATPVPTKSVPAAAHPSSAEPATTPPAQHVPSPPIELCAETNLLTRSMCIYRNCQKPENTHLPVCIEDRKRWENRN